VEREVELPLNSAETVTHYTLVPCTLKHNQRASFSLTVEMATGNRSWFPFLLTACDVSRQCVQVQTNAQNVFLFLFLTYTYTLVPIPVTKRHVLLPWVG